MRKCNFSSPLGAVKVLSQQRKIKGKKTKDIMFKKNVFVVLVFSFFYFLSYITSANNKVYVILFLDSFDAF